MAKNKGSTLEARLIEDLDTSVDTIDTKVGTNTDAVGTTTLFARLRQIVDTYLADGTVGLTALKALIDANQVDLDAIIVDTTSIEIKVDAIQTDLDNATDGLGALKTLIDANQVDLDTIIVDTTSIETKVDAIQTDLDNATDGLGALKALIDANQSDLDSILVDTGNVKLKAKTFAETGTDTQLTIANGTGEVTIKTFDKATYGAGFVRAFKIDLDKVTSGFQTLAAVSSTIIIRVYEKIDGTNYRLRTDDGQSYTWTQGVTTDKVIELNDISFSEDCDVRAVLSAAPTGTVNLPWLCELNQDMEV